MLPSTGLCCRREDGGWNTYQNTELGAWLNSYTLKTHITQFINCWTISAMCFCQRGNILPLYFEFLECSKNLQ
jgi:hypothetical protein